MKAKRVRVIILVCVLLSQSILALSAMAISALDHITHDHASHDHSLVMDNAQASTNAELENSHSGDHTLHATAATTHDCGPCLDGDMSLCQCCGIFEIHQIFISMNHASISPLWHTVDVLAAHNLSLYRPPIAV